MYLYSGSLKEKDRRMVAQDYYEKFEKLNDKKSNYRNMSIESIKNGTNNFICRLVDKNYSKTVNYLTDNEDLYEFMVALKNDQYCIAYAVVRFDSYNASSFIVDDIIIHNEEKYEILAEGQINICYNIYRKIIEHIHSNLPIEWDVTVRFNMIDSKELYEALRSYGYETINNDVHNSTDQRIVD